ncbi:hypothetical protein FRC15_007010 [Serendipita sp. 397]|nr:hypothetical protein FRC15_007010 [Serendipita sp. 397]
MFDENVCFTCGENAPGNSLYCSEKCRLLDSGDVSTSTSNSSVAPSSASSSPSRTSPSVGAAKHRKDRSRAPTGFGNWTSRASSRTSSPSVQSSDLPDFSDYDLDVVGGDFKTGDSLDLKHSHSTLKNDQKFMDHAFWSSRYGDFGVATPPGGRNQEGTEGSKSMPGVMKALEYVRKPGPINAHSQMSSSSKASAGYSPHSISHAYKRYSSEYAYPFHATRVHDAVTREKNLSRKGSGESATSSTPRSKAAAALSSSSTQLQTTVSESVIVTPQLPSSSATGTVRHVSDSMVHTLRRAIQPFTSTNPLESSTVPSTDRRDSAALTNLKDVARSHGMRVGDGGKLRSRQPAAGSVQQQHHAGTRDAQVDSTPDFNVTAANRGRPQKRVSLSRSPSPPSWASWAENEPVERRRGRSSHRGH